MVNTEQSSLSQSLVSRQQDFARPKLYLASASPRRHELLNQIGVAHEVLNVPAPPGEDEPRLENESPLEYVQRTALDKSLRAQDWIGQNAELQSTHLQPTEIKSAASNRCAILTADTTVCIGNRVLGKPKDQEEAEIILGELSGKTHSVYTALVLSQLDFEGNNKWRQWRALSETLVTFREMKRYEIQAYIETGEPFGKAGAYGIQGYAAKFISKIVGSYSGVMGLPLFEASELLKELR